MRIDNEKGKMKKESESDGRGQEERTEKVKRDREVANKKR